MDPHVVRNRYCLFTDDEPDRIFLHVSSQHERQESGYTPVTTAVLRYNSHSSSELC
jgi:hypothetical protein